MVEFYSSNHDYEAVMRRIQSDEDISAANKKLADDFLRHLLACDLSHSTIKTYLEKYKRLCGMTKKDLRKLTDKDIEDIQIENNRLQNSNSKKQHNKMFRLLLRFMGKYKPDTFNRLMKMSFKEDHELKINSQDLPTTEEIKKMILTAPPMYKAMIALQSECGMRPSELCTLQIGSVEHDKTFSKVQIMESKTKKRINHAIASDAYLREWIAQHPNKDDTTAPLFPSFYRKNNGMAYLTPPGYVKALKTIALQSGIKKRMYAYLLRHYAITKMLRKGWSMAMIQDIVGHTIGSKTIRKYSHLSDEDQKNYVLERAKEEQQRVITEGKEIDYVLCNFCKTKNTFEAYYCTECARPLNLKALAEIENRKVQQDEFVHYAINFLLMAMSKKNLATRERLTQKEIQEDAEELLRRYAYSWENKEKHEFSIEIKGGLLRLNKKPKEVDKV